MTLRGILVPRTPEHDKRCDLMCSKVDLYGEMACTKLGDLFSPPSRARQCTGVCFPNADGSIVWGKFFHHVVVVGLEPELASRTHLLPNCSADVVLSRTDEGAGAK